MRALVAALIFLAVLGGSSTALTQDGSDQKHDGKFTGIAIVTGNLKWFELFNRPETPQLEGQDTFRPGERGAVALIFSNAEPRKGLIKIECDITAFDTAGISQVVAEAASCYEGRYYGDNVLTPALLDLQFEIGQDDPAGRAGFHITARDAHSGRSVKLSVAFTQDTGVSKS